MGPAQRLGNDVVDHAELLEVAAGELQGGGGVGGVGSALPQDAAAAFRADDRIPGVLHHGHAVGHADAQRPAGAALAGDDRDDRHPQPAHFQQISRDALGLPALFGADAGIGPGGVDQADHRQVELLGQLHTPQRLAVALGVRQAERAADLFLGVPALVMPDQHHLVVGRAGQAAHDGRVVAVAAVAVELAELAADGIDVVLEQRPLGMPRHLHRFPGREVVVGLAEQRGVIGAKLAKLFGIVSLLGRLHRLDFVNLLLELGQGLFEIEHMPRHGSLAVLVFPGLAGE